MIQAAPAHNDLIEQFNHLKSTGRLLEPRRSMMDHRTVAAISKAVDEQRNIGYAPFYAMKSSLAALQGDSAGVMSAVNALRKLTPCDEHWMLHAINSLYVAGEFSLAYQELMRDQRLAMGASNAEVKLALACYIQAFDYLRDYLPILERMQVNGISEDTMNMASMNASFSSVGVDEISARKMLDAAGKAFKKNKRTIDDMRSVVEGGNLYLYLLVVGDSDLAAKIEWDYTGYLFDDFAEAPVERISIIVESYANGSEQ